MPNLSAKELTGLGEQLGLEQMLVAKYKAMASQATDKSLEQKFNDIASKHQCHYDSLKNYIG